MRRGLAPVVVIIVLVIVGRPLWTTAKGPHCVCGPCQMVVRTGCPGPESAQRGCERQSPPGKRWTARLRPVGRRRATSTQRAGENA